MTRTDPEETSVTDAGAATEITTKLSPRPLAQTVERLTDQLSPDLARNLAAINALTDALVAP
jgi:hypothetical protein